MQQDATGCNRMQQDATRTQTQTQTITRIDYITDDCVSDTMQHTLKRKEIVDNINDCVSAHDAMQPYISAFRT